MNLEFVNDLSVWTIINFALYPLGIILSVVALWNARSSQAASAWIISLITMPIVSIPLFLIFGRNKFKGYTRGQKDIGKKLQAEFEDVRNFITNDNLPPIEHLALGNLAARNHQAGFTSANDIELLIDGKATYESILEGIMNAKKYILFQYYIFSLDETGRLFADALIKKSKEGVKVYFLYDQIGTGLTRKFKNELKEAGIFFADFSSSQNFESNFQINFRNHRKIVVIDGETAYLGGLNIGNEYLGRSRIGKWRDTHVKITGRVTLAGQLSFLKDWYWSTQHIPTLNWKLNKEDITKDTMILHTGPADHSNAALLTLMHLIETAQTKIWFATPYFIPPETLSQALILAVLRGVDVRIILPKKSDNFILKRASTVYITNLMKAGIKFYYYEQGFMHQKVILSDDTGMVGSINLDNRSIFINFEIMLISKLESFVKNLEAMLIEDFSNSTLISHNHFKKWPILRKLFARLVNLFAPIL